MYISEYTDFQAFEPPYTDKIYYKEGDKTLCIIHVDENWNMWGEVKDPYNIPIDILNPKFKPLNQKQCEELIMIHMPPRHRTDVKKRWGMDKIDYAILMYKTRLITLIDSYWVAWSEDDKAEDYHPRYNEKLMEKRFEGAIQIDPEPEDLEESTPILTFEERAERFGEIHDDGPLYIDSEFINLEFD